jgi:hypothetical protein
MALRGKISVWITVLLVLVGILLVIPVASKSTLLEQIESWFDDYSEAVDSAQGDDDESSADVATIPAGKMMVRIEDEIGAYAGVETVNLVQTSFFPESKALAIVVDLRPLLALRARHNQALAALNVANVAERAAAAELARLKTLAKGTGSVATKNVSYAEATWHEAKAKLQGLNFDLQAIHDEALQIWGEVISSWILTEDSTQWQRLLSRQDSLLLVTLPLDISLATEVSDIRIARDGSRQQARKAYFVSAALATDQVIQGETYYFKTATDQLRTGMRLDAWLPEGLEPLNGVFIPDEAIVWNDGQAWVYVKLEDDLYQRRSLLSGLVAAGGVFMTDELSAADTLVMRGSQMLLSEEFRWQIEGDD